MVDETRASATRSAPRIATPPARYGLGAPVATFPATNASRRCPCSMTRALVPLLLVTWMLAACGSKDAPKIVQLIATYGENCGAPRGNATEHIARACLSKPSCDYMIDHKVIGDPKVGCRKTFTVDWRCSGDSSDRRLTVSAEAGLGSHAGLDCAGPPIKVATPTPTPTPTPRKPLPDDPSEAIGMSFSQYVGLNSMRIELVNGTTRRGMLKSAVTITVRGERITVKENDPIAITSLTPGPRWTVVRLNDQRALKGTIEPDSLTFRDASGPDFTIRVADLKTMGYGVASPVPDGWVDLEPLRPAPTSFDCQKIRGISDVTSRYMSADRMVAVALHEAPPLIVVDPQRAGRSRRIGIDVLSSVVDELNRCKGTKRSITATPIAVEDLVAGDAWSKPGYVVTTNAIRIGTWQAPRVISDVRVTQIRTCPQGGSTNGIRLELSRPIVDACDGQASCAYERADFFSQLPKEAGTVCQATYQLSWRCPEEGAPRVLALQVTVDKPLQVQLDCRIVARSP